MLYRFIEFIQRNDAFHLIVTMVDSNSSRYGDKIYITFNKPIKKLSIVVEMKLNTVYNDHFHFKSTK